LKLSKSSWIFIVVGIILIAAVGLGMSRSQQTEQIESLKSRLAQAKQKLALVKNDDLIARKNELTLQLEGYNAQNESARQKLLSPEDSISTTDILLESAHKYGLLVSTMSSPGQSGNKLGEMECTTLPISLQVQGNIHDITNFICNLGLLFPTSIVKTVQLSTAEAVLASGPGASPESSPAPEFIPGFVPEKNTSASINLVIYSYEDR
jgi:Tfp pilus assembly protein PilO